MLCICPASVKVTGIALLTVDDDAKLKTSLLPISVGITTLGVNEQYTENLKLAFQDLPKADGNPDDHVLPVLTLAGAVVRSYLIFETFSNTHASQTFCPEVTVTGIVRDTVCQPAVVVTEVEGVTPKSSDGMPATSEYTPSMTLPDPAL